MAASTDLTGAESLGGDWDLEASVGSVGVSVVDEKYSSLLQISSNTNFNYPDALLAAEFSNYAYEDNKIAIKDWMNSINWQPIIGSNLDVAGGYEVGNAYAFAAKNISPSGAVKFIVSFEGSNDNQLADWTVTNATEYGWSNYYASLMPLVAEVYKQALDEKANGKYVEIIFTGHSLGGAAAGVAFADLSTDPAQGVWAESHSPLQNGFRVYNQNSLSQYNYQEINNLRNNTTVYSFGAPSFLIDSTKPSETELNNLISHSILVDFFLNRDFDSFLSQWKLAISDALSVNTNLLISDLSTFPDHIFQFEHKSSSINVFDPVSTLGTMDSGTVINVDLLESIYNKYVNNYSSIDFLALHAMYNYVETIYRSISGDNFTNIFSNALLPLVSYGTNGNDLVLSQNGVSFGLYGNDIIQLVPSSIAADAGIGNDVYVVNSYGVNAHINSSFTEKVDVLNFNLYGTVSADQVTDDNSNALTFRISSPNGVSTVTVDNWYSATGTYQLNSIIQIRPHDYTYWTSQEYSLASLNVYNFFNQ